MTRACVHGYDPGEKLRRQDQASTLVELLHSDTTYPEGSRVLDAGCGGGAQTVLLAARNPKLGSLPSTSRKLRYPFFLARSVRNPRVELHAAE